MCWSTGILGVVGGGEKGEEGRKEGGGWEEGKGEHLSSTIIHILEHKGWGEGKVGGWEREG